MLQLFNDDVLSAASEILIGQECLRTCVFIVNRHRHTLFLIMYLLAFQTLKFFCFLILL